MPGSSRRLGNERGFARTAGAGDDEDDWLARRRHDHSMFCACSRNFSISDLISRARSVMARPEASTPGVLERRVLASRCISCKRKSSFLPISPPVSRVFQIVRRGWLGAKVLRRCRRVRRGWRLPGVGCAKDRREIRRAIRGCGLRVWRRRLDANRKPWRELFWSANEFLRGAISCRPRARRFPMRCISSRRAAACCKHAPAFAARRASCSSLRAPVRKPRRRRLLGDAR